jgi:uncharacterized membrane protein YkoI
MRRWRTIVSLLAVLLLSGGAPAQGWRTRTERGKFISPSQAVEAARRQADGRVLSVDLIQDGGGRAHYRVKMIQGGKVRVVNVDAYARE